MKKEETTVASTEAVATTPTKKRTTKKAKVEVVETTPEVTTEVDPGDEQPEMAIEPEVIAETEEVIDLTITETEEEKSIRLGRPVVPGSARQEKLAGYEAKREAGIEVKRGRPSNPDSERAKRLAKQAERALAGLPKRPGRPKMVKEEIPAPSDVVISEVETTEFAPVEEVVNQLVTSEIE